MPNVRGPSNKADDLHTDADGSLKVASPHSASSAGPVAVPAAGNTALATISCANHERLFVQFSVATQALDAFLVQARCSADASFATLYSAGADFTSPSGLLVDASGDLTAVAAAGTGWFVMDVRGLYEVKLLASAAVDSAAVTVFAGGQ
jgi:hypothetical protein